MKEIEHGDSVSQLALEAPTSSKISPTKQKKRAKKSVVKNSKLFTDSLSILKVLRRSSTMLCSVETLQRGRVKTGWQFTQPIEIFSFLESIMNIYILYTCSHHYAWFAVCCYMKRY